MSQFPTTEINGSFYRTPSLDAVRTWRYQTPAIGHGPGGRYKGHYSDRTLRAWAREIAGWRRQRRIVFVYFDNDQKSAAPADARRLMEMLKIDWS